MTAAASKVPAEMAVKYAAAEGTTSSATGRARYSMTVTSERLVWPTRSRRVHSPRPGPSHASSGIRATVSRTARAAAAKLDTMTLMRLSLAVRSPAVTDAA